MVRFGSSLTSQPTEVETKIADTSDPNRSPFFQYSWGSWMKNDAIEKAKRQTRFSIEGTTKLVQLLFEHYSAENNNFKVQTPKSLADGSVILSHNLSLVGKSDGSLSVKSISSIHEGKSNRIYKISLSNGTELVLRLPYKLESEYSIGEKIKSEVATNDFLSLKLGLKVPRILSYGANKLNFLQSPYILMEYIPGDLLMKQWEPLITDEVPDSKQKLEDVIKPIADFQNATNSVVFNKFGSLYFTADVEGYLQSDLPYEGESNELFVNRWRIGPSVEKSFLRNKNKLKSKQITTHNGPWPSDQPEAVIASIAKIELENLTTRLGLAEADSSNQVENIQNLKNSIATFENLAKMAPLLLNKASKSIPNVEELFKPRLFVPDLDPLNVIANSDRNNELFFTDFEYSSIKPFVLFNYPKFVAYSGVKIYNLEEDIPNFKELDELEQQQYQFMYYKTRNERLWELELNKNRHDLIAVASPHVKVLKSPYLQALEYKSDRDYLYVEGSILQLKGLWEAYVANELCNAQTPEFPIDYTPEVVEQFQSDLQAYQTEISSTPFAATGGWVPQDMFDQLKDGGLLKQTPDGYEIETEKLLQQEQEANQ
ncbi:hypothetical protein CANTEDRAFT_114216 [Yamadazyma tenuis ATCC 10573]|nr:uncharacterized protein CANTEDRAFT_114216 [Yamadazyma tenuis ATCC 10573]EGV64400.1 hypothetical protein CANTEDRAFT_114216 [Yamadazyma tenuis ATCC 10573]